MVKVWNSYPDVEKAVETITKIYNETTTLPDVYVKAVEETLAHSSKGLVQRFYERLTEKCPAALQHF